MTIRVGRFKALSHSRPGPDRINVIVGIRVVTFVKRDEQGGLLVSEKFACENPRDQMGEVGVSCGHRAVVHIVAEVRG